MRLLSALTLTALCFGATAAEAQTASIREFGSRDSDEFGLPIGADDCANNISITFQVMGLASANTLAVFYGSNCASGNNRLGSNGTTQSCFEVAHVEYNSLGTQDITFTAQDLKCNDSDDLDESRNIFFLTLPSAGDGSDVSGTNILAYTPAIEIDTKAPSAPTEVNGGTGETDIPVSWKLPSGDTLNELIVYWDITDDPTCSSDLLVAGQPVEEAGVGSKDDLSPTSTSTILSNVVDVGEYAAVAVVAVDLAGNRSVASNVSCIEGVPTTSWWDLHQAQGGKTGSTCSVATMNTQRALVLAMWLSVVAYFVVRSRRRIS